MENNPNVEAYPGAFGHWAAESLGQPFWEPAKCIQLVEELLALPNVDDFNHEQALPTTKSVGALVARLGLSMVRHGEMPEGWQPREFPRPGTEGQAEETSTNPGGFLMRKAPYNWGVIYERRAKGLEKGQNPYSLPYIPAVGVNLRDQGGIEFKLPGGVKYNVKRPYNGRVEKDSLECFPDPTFDDPGLQEQAAKLKLKVEAATSDYDREKLQEQLAKLVVSSRGRKCANGLSIVWYMLCGVLFDRGYPTFTADSRFHSGFLKALQDINDDSDIDLGISQKNVAAGKLMVTIPSLHRLEPSGPRRTQERPLSQGQKAASLFTKVSEAADSVSG